MIHAAPSSPDGPHYRAALAVAERLHAHGHAAYFAGGCVRDLLLGVRPRDFDVATSARPEEVMALFPKTFAVGAHFGVVLVCQAVSAEPDEIAIEVATFRHDGAYSDGRRPDQVRFSNSPEEDVLRRDFTINGMLLDPIAYDRTGDLDASILDRVGGRSDLAAGTIRAIGAPAVRFAEDKLRMMRAVRFAARLGFEIAAETAAAIRLQAAEISSISAERIRDELTRILTEGGAARGFELLRSLDLLAAILPEAMRMIGVPQPPEYHPEGDVWTHTMLLLQGLPAGCSPTLAWGALLHDIGKPATFQPPDPQRTLPDGRPDRIRFNGHVSVGVRIAETILARLRFGNDDTAQIVGLVENHMRFGDILQMKRSTRTRFLRLPRFAEHLALHRLDCLASHGDLRLYEFALAAFDAEPTAADRPAPLLTGRDLIAAGYRPSPQFKPMLALAEDAQLEASIHTTAEALALVRQHYPFAGPTV